MPDRGINVPFVCEAAPGLLAPTDLPITGSHGALD